MHKTAKKLLTSVITVGTIILYSILPAQALEYNLPVDKPIEKMVTTLILEDTYLKDTIIETFYKDGTKKTEMDDNSDNKIDLSQMEEQLDENTKRVSYTYKGRSTGFSIEKKLEDGSVKTDFFNSKGNLSYYTLAKTDDKGVKITDTYFDGHIDERTKEWVRYDGVKVIERGLFVGYPEKRYEPFERISEDVSPAGVKQRTHDFNVTDNITDDMIELETTKNGVKRIIKYHRDSKGKLHVGGVRTEISIKLKK